MFNRVARAVVDAQEAESDLGVLVLTELAEALTDADWDTVDESVEEFRDHPGIVAALFRAAGDRDVAGRWLGTMGFDDGGDQWVLSCGKHGVLVRSDGPSAEEHDRLVRLWAIHDQDAHGGDGVVDEQALICRN